MSKGGKIKVAVLDDYQNVARKYGDWSAVETDAEVTVFHDHAAGTDAVVARLRDFQVVCVNRERTPMTRDIISKLPQLKLIVTTGFTNPSIDVKAATEHGMLVCGSGPDEEACSELAWGLILALARFIPMEDRSVRGGGWQTRVGRDMRRKTLGILGLGNIGARVAKIGQAFGMDVIAWSENLTPEKAAERHARYVQKDELFAQSDVLTIHLWLGERTRKMVGAREFALMKPTSVLINTARGPIVDEAALVDALLNKRIAGAGLDVFDVEPLPSDHPLLKLDNVVLTPHIGGVTEERYHKRIQDSVDDVRAWLDGKPIRQFDLTGRLAGLPRKAS